MDVIKDPHEMQAVADEVRKGGSRLALVPTMGALHRGHASLLAAAGSRADHITATIFVNPTQFSPGEDFATYPRALESDLKQLRNSPAPPDVVFCPDAASIYPPGASTWVEIDGLSDQLCGAFRPGHFRGVSTVVSKFFLICKPHVALFGKKDAQQYLILKRMTRDLHFDVEIVGVPTVREADGLAVSSRNVYLSEEHRKQASVLHAALKDAEMRISAGEQHVQGIVKIMLEIIGSAPDARVQYVSVVDTGELQPLARIPEGQEVLVAVAVFFGTTRLIDNIFVQAPD